MEEIKLKLKKYKQEHLLRFYEELNSKEKKHLIDQINSIDFEFIKKLYKDVNKKEKDKNITSMDSEVTNEEYERVGLKSVNKGEYALITMAGGQGSRLGFEGPKGCYILKYGINKSLFEIQCDELKEIHRKTGIYIPWLIMTSYDNNDATVTFFEKNKYFNYPKDKIKFFIQEELPMIDIYGKVLMNSKSNIVMGANGHGGVFSALKKYHLIDYLKESGVKWIFMGGIDNVLLPIDTLDLLGFAIKKKLLAASKTVLKAYPEEKVGVFCLKNNKPAIIEYIWMTEEMNNKRDKNGNLVYKDVHTITNIFNIKVFEKVAKNNLKYYAALKKAEYIDENGLLIKPEKENSYKFECFLFDAFSILSKKEFGLLQGKREEIFAPIKNSDGVDSPETAAKLYNDYHNKGGK